MALAGKVGAVYVQNNSVPVAFTNEATTADGTYKKYTITNTSKRFIDKNTTVTVKKNAVTQTFGFSIDYAGGTVIFDDVLTGGDSVTITGANVSVSQIGGFFNWSVDAGADAQEITVFGSNGWKEFQAGLKEWSASAEAYWGNGDFFNNLGKELIFVFYLDSGTAKLRFEGLGIITGDGIESSIDDVIQESIDIQGTGVLGYREG